MVKDNKIKPWEVVLAIIILFLACSTSLYWYDYFNKFRKQNVESAMKAKWEKDTLKWQKDATDNINGLRQSQQEVLDVINLNVNNGRLVMPQKEKK
jgi:heme/copper-type cytochrome/quinol oxidase subunit 1